MKSEYTYSINECDVEDKSKLHAFREKRLRWTAWLDEDPHHAIWSTIHELVWRDVQFAAIGQLASDNPDGPLNTSLIADAIIGGHVAQQVLAIRRLTDRNRNRISLARLISDVKNSRDLLTRENIVCYDGLPYDYQAAAATVWAERQPDVAYWGDTAGPRAYTPSELAHKQFDKIAGISSTNRTRGDLIPKSVFVQLENLLISSEANRIADWSHAYLAHAGMPLDRQAVSNVAIDNQKIGAAILELARITEFVSTEVLWIGGYAGSLMPTPQYDVFEKIENPIATTDRQNEAALVWERKTDEWDSALADVDTMLNPSAT